MKSERKPSKTARLSAEVDELRLKIAAHNNFMAELANRLWPHLEDAVSSLIDDRRW